MTPISEYDSNWIDYGEPADPPPSPERIKAIHYAGHAAIAVAQDVEIKLLTLKPLSEVDVNLDGAYLLDEGTILHFTQPQPENPSYRYKASERLLQIALAGQCAELVHRDISCSIELVMEAVTDFELVLDNAETLIPDKDLRLSYLVRDIVWMDRFLRMPEFRTVVCEISDALLEHGVLNGDRVKEIYDEAMKSDLDAPARRPSRRRRRPDYSPMPYRPDLNDCPVF
ncbi:MAG: hypothetical protein H6822_25005 [Planctomycetaceae bacterium]|nr:hypothetical protein [Planctomycetales bacterium]MCB9925437.1 hypothetical protein [Planctomycetaceae bacterium]